MYKRPGCQPTVAVLKHFVLGNVPQGFVSRALNEIRGLLEVMDRIDYLEVYFYGSAYEKMAFLEEEALDLGVLVVGDYTAMHEAWRGWPRIHIDYERCSRLADEQLKAVIAHEVAHAVLHGSPLYYTISIGNEMPAGLDQDEAIGLIYIASTIVKDLDVHELLAALGLASAIDWYASFLAEQTEDTRCRNAVEILGLAKAVLPCLYTSRCNVLEKLDRDCGALAKELLGVLATLRNSRSGDLSSDTMLLVRLVLPILKPHKRGLEESSPPQ